MAIRGNLQEASLPDIIQLLSLGRKTGVLSVSDKKNFGDIFFKDGKIIYCSIVNREERIGNLLLKSNDITKEQLEKALEYQEEIKSSKRLGDILVDMNFVSKEVLEERIKQQITDSIFTLLTWKSGFFNFEPNIEPITESITVEIDADDILLEEARKVDEWSIIEKELPSEKTVLVKTGIKKEEDIENQSTRYVFSLVDGHRTLKDIFEHSKIGKYETGKEVYTLLKLGYIYSGEEKNSEIVVDSHNKIAEHYNLGIAFLLTEMYEEAIREFKHIIQLDKTDAKSYFYLGLIYFRTGNYNESLKYFEEILKLGIINVSLFNNIALTYERLGMFERAEEFYERAVKLEPENSKILANYGILLFKENLFAEAEEKLRMALNIDRGLKYAKFFLALINFEYGMVDQATEILFELSKSDPSVWQYYFNIGQIYLSIGKYESAENFLKKSVETCGDEILPYKSLVDFYFLEKNFEAAEIVLEQIINLNRSDFDVFYRLGNIKYRKGKKEEALKFWEEALKLQPDNEILKKTIKTVKNE
ncbi:MAG: Uncharacterized protein XD76_0321 [candidate division TA06 bacterium 32_111]|uniref:PatA-like N-terminal domain-containing protein n=2 Tax=Bacteria candidate phyla TaxID=1783234 RepID=A0A101I2M8_UNCT6|nr:MAG: Uncharacterized protein XD76_0321 [candidate division TA06 bacterium 32_111]KUK87646.1 MAG: Uncharacterized protein XE03_0537 [candidate division TA06 bacterium 34_109]HAF07485.1 hypothetical protein [candidate division WOR-3 bacterium]HCP17554.1 hypothetical protein [candidate division WOR-3 bacterium]